MQQVVAGLNADKARQEEELAKSKALIEKLRLESQEKSQAISEMKITAQQDREAFEAKLNQLKAELETVQTEKNKLSIEKTALLDEYAIFCLTITN